MEAGEGSTEVHDAGDGQLRFPRPTSRRKAMTLARTLSST